MTDFSIEQIQYLYEEDKLVEAYNLMQNLPQELIKSIPILTQIEEDYLETRKLLNEFQDESDWISEKEGNIHISYKKVKNTPTISIKCESIIDVPLFDFLTLIYETDLYPDWVPFCKSSKTLQKISRSKKVVVCEFDVIHIAKRAACVLGYGYNLLHTEGYVLIVSKSIPTTYKTSYTLSELNFFGCLLHPISKSSISVKLISNMDPKIYILPYSLLNWAVRKMARLMFEKLTEKSKQFSSSSSPNHAILPENSDFYEHLSRSLREYFESNRIDN